LGPRQDSNLQSQTP